MDARPGTYALVLQADTAGALPVGRWGVLDMQPGHYIYIGSAFGPGGVRARVARHCRLGKLRHWHIDHLREHATPVAVWYTHDAERLEHRWAAAMNGLRGLRPVAGFGCSDCDCGSHLFFAARRPRFDRFAAAVGGVVESADCAEAMRATRPR